MDKNIEWHKIEGTSRHGLADFKPGEIKSFEAGKHKLCLVISEDKPYAVNHKCPHSGGRMAKGYVEDNCIVCPLHRYKFSLETGRTVGGEGAFIKNYPVEVRDDGLYVGIPKKKFLGLF